jgi:predicted ATP-dependent Lon-type protease
MRCIEELKPIQLSKFDFEEFVEGKRQPLVEPNFNFIELGPRGNGKSYTFSEFSPYATLLGAPTLGSHAVVEQWAKTGRHHRILGCGRFR